MRLLFLLFASTAAAAPVIQWSKIPLSFEPGKTPVEASYLARGTSFSLSVAPGSMLAAGKGRTRLRTKLVGANPSARATGEDRQSSTSNYFVGSDPRQWRTAVPNYAKVRYSAVYPGIDLVYYGNEGTLEYDWIVGPGADPQTIRMEFEGADRLRIDKHGDLVIRAGKDEYRHKRPQIYQQTADRRVPVSGDWVLKGKEGSFRVGPYDRSKELIIDPPLIYSTYHGGASSDYGLAVAVDSIGNTYVTGKADSTNFPTAGPLQSSLSGVEDAFVTKFSPDGSTRLFSTYLGGGGTDEGDGIAVDDQGNIYVTGTTASLNFPLKNPIQTSTGGSSDAFVAKLNASGTALVYSTYLGGNANDFGAAIAVDSSRNAYVVGTTFSANFPTAAAFQAAKGAQQDAFVAKLNASGNALVYSTFLGGNNVDQGSGIAVDAAGNAYLTGYTESTDFPVQSAFQGSNRGNFEAFVTKINPAGSALVYSTYLGGAGGDEGVAVAVDASGDAYVTGSTTSKDFPLASPIEPTLHSTGVDDLFVTKLNPAGSALVFSTYLGGGSEDAPFALALDRDGNAWITGRTNSSDFPLASPLQATRSAFDMFVSEISGSGSALLFSTFVGGNGSESGRGIAVDSIGNIHVTGEGTSTDFPLLKAVQTANGSASNPQDAFVFLLGDHPVQSAPVITTVSDNLIDGGPLVPGGWFYVKGTNLADVQRIWASSDFTDSSTLPTNLNGVEVWVNGAPVPVYFISPGQVNAQAPLNIGGSVTVQVVRLGLASNTMTAPVIQLQPSLYNYQVGGKDYAAALFLDYTLMGDPAVTPGTRKANPGDVIQLYAAGLAPSASGSMPTQPVPVSGVGVTIGSTDAAVSAAALVAPGQFQVNFTVPPLPAGEYPIVVTKDGKSSQAGVLFEVGP